MGWEEKQGFNRNWNFSRVYKEGGFEQIGMEKERS